ncbi:TetR/AcrR family transcriptional regulator [Streptomyces pseudovenezuelae]|uniref:AcrR family transcriptional regulator n=1 Tax=Streptomyces pseudovenezuelae TaxID=67350 RepID=A0ABT6LP50_9ACTN|nr:helix-turn-helix domain-containing protein [Streptomyces pseudovenezuelae]MDH6218079.1 AcrR family transcriptional regulator [Streptomyces pseudovenezuelae]
MEIADEAVRLFVSQGVAATTAEDIAAAAGVSTRTLWRYLRSKEDCARPLLTAGMDLITARLRTHWGQGGSLAQAFADADDPGLAAAQHVDALRDLVRLSRDEPGLRAVWLQARFDAEAVFAGVIADGTDRSAHDLAVRLEAGMLNAALRIVVEDWALRPDDPAGPSVGETLAQALHTMTQLLDPEASVALGRKPMILRPATGPRSGG